MGESISDRLRGLRDRNGWTVADMAERTGIPKRTLDKYMLRQGASLPGFDALLALSKGLGVSLDWLIFGAEGASKGVQLVAERACNIVARRFAEKLLAEYHAKNGRIVEGERILNLKPEALAHWLGSLAGDEASAMIVNGVSLEELLLWQRRQQELAGEHFDDMVNELLPDVKWPPKAGLKQP